jgi:ABC-type phosphate transport system substrate-binding protein
MLLICANSFCNNQNDNQKEPSANSVSILSSPEIYSLANEWSVQYEKERPNAKVTIEKLNPGAVSEENHIYLTTENTQLSDNPRWKMVIGREAIVPVINQKNPLLEKILPRGMTSQNFRQLLTGAKQDWGTLMNTQEASPLHLYIVDDEQLINRVANFSGMTPQAVREKMTPVPREVLSVVQKDPYAMAFCNLTDVLVAETNQFAQGIRIMPIDKNSNGRMDHFENIYSNPEAFTRGVWIGKYPAALCSNIYAMASSKPESQAALDFLTWIQTDGQPLLNQSGFSSLAINERRSNIESLNVPVTPEPGGKRTFPVLGDHCCFFADDPCDLVL